MDASALSSRVTFQSPIHWRDADGQQQHGWRPEFREWVKVHYLRGGESVMASRMQSRNPAILTVRASRQAERITSEWRALVNGKAFEVKEDPRPTPDRAFYEMLAEG